MGVLLTGRTGAGGAGAGSGEAALTADTELELEVMEVPVPPDTPPLLELSAPLLLPLFFAETLLSSDWLLQHSYKLGFRSLLLHFSLSSPTCGVSSSDPPSR